VTFSPKQGVGKACLCEYIMIYEVAVSLDVLPCSYVVMPPVRNFMVGEVARDDRLINHPCVTIM
jgi:hypothetical protein